MYCGFLFGWLIGFCCAMILIELLHDSAERKGGYSYYDDCWGNAGENPPPKSSSPGVPGKGRGKVN